MKRMRIFTLSLALVVLLLLLEMNFVSGNLFRPEFLRREEPTNSFAVELSVGDDDEAGRLANKYGFIYRGRVSQLPLYMW